MLSARARRRRQGGVPAFQLPRTLFRSLDTDKAVAGGVGPHITRRDGLVPVGQHQVQVVDTDKPVLIQIAFQGAHGGLINIYPLLNKVQNQQGGLTRRIFTKGHALGVVKPIPSDPFLATGQGGLGQAGGRAVDVADVDLRIGHGGGDAVEVCRLGDASAAECQEVAAVGAKPLEDRYVLGQPR